jgi:hypothetical protein
MVVQAGLKHQPIVQIPLNLGEVGANRIEHQHSCVML